MDKRPGQSVLLVEDERNLGATLSERLAAAGHDVAWQQSAQGAINALDERRFDLAILDVALPDGTGFDVAAHIRKRSLPTATLFLTAFGASEQRIKGLELGAEDYVVKPFNMRELLLRVQNALRRARYLRTADAEDTAHIGRALVTFSAMTAVVDGTPNPLSQKECALLRLLQDCRGKVLSRDTILQELWSADEFPTSRTVDNFILKLRKLVEPDIHNPTVIRSVRGVGYQLE